MTEAEKQEPKKRPKMTLGEQAEFVFSMLRRCHMSAPDIEGNKPIWTYPDEAMLRLEGDDFLRLETIWQSLMFFELHGADKMVRDKIIREAKGRRK